MSDQQHGDVVIPLYGEDVEVSKVVVETGRLAITRVTRERSEPIAESLTEETVEIGREPIGRFVEKMPAIREEGDTLVVPVVEERLVIQRRLFLKEEVRVKRVRVTRTHRERVALRHHEVLIDAVPAQTPSTEGSPPGGEAPGVSTLLLKNRSGTMSYQTIVAAFDSGAHAQAAAAALKAAGFHSADISILDKSRSPSIGADKPSLWHRLFGDQVRQHEAAVYDRTIASGGTVLSVRVPDNEVAHATGIIDLHHPIDVHDRALTSGVVPASRAGAAASPPPPPVKAQQKVAVSPKLADVNEQVVRLAEEQLQVGKRKIETGKTRVKRYVTERDASADVTLHEEHAEVLRRAVADPKYLGDVDWSDSTIEVVETAEQALVNKTAKVVEEVSLKKIGSDHVQTLHEKIRRQQVDVERLDSNNRPIVDR